MSAAIEPEALKAFSLFDGMTEDELASSAELFEPMRRMAGERVTQEDDFGYSLFLVMQGRVEVEVGGEIVDHMDAGDFFGERSLVTGERRNATVRAVETCEFAKIMVWDFSELTARNADLAARIERVANERTHD